MNDEIHTYSAFITVTFIRVVFPSDVVGRATVVLCDATLQCSSKHLRKKTGHMLQVCNGFIYLQYSDFEHREQLAHTDNVRESNLLTSEWFRALQHL